MAFVTITCVIQNHTELLAEAFRQFHQHPPVVRPKKLPADSPLKLGKAKGLTADQNYKQLQRLLRHRHGTDQVWESAEELGLHVESLVRLADRLESMDKNWRLPRERVPRLAGRLLAKDWPLSKIARLCRIGTETLKSWVEEGPGLTETGLAKPLSMRGRVF